MALQLAADDDEAGVLLFRLLDLLRECRGIALQLRRSLQRPGGFAFVVGFVRNGRHAACIAHAISSCSTNSYGAAAALRGQSMSFALTSDKGNAVPIHSVTAATLPAWLERNGASRDWISAVGFKAE